MSKKASRVSFVLLAVGLIAVVAILVAVQKSVTANNVNSVNPMMGEDIVAKYQYLSSLDLDAKKDIYNKSIASDKSALWRIHMTTYLAEHPDLTSEQQQVILEGITLATTKFFEMSGDDIANKIPDLDKKIVDIRTRARAVFPKGQAGEIFTSLGHGKTAKISSGIATVRIDNCNCSRNQDFCWNSCGVSACNGSMDCGWWWSVSCNGMCT